MAYEVTATRRRPQNFESLIGQEFVAETLKNSIQSEKIAHAYLFSGPRGCGKTSTARILAKALNCRKGPTATPCGECDACREITAGSSLDVIEIDGASNTSVNDVRQIKDEVLFPPNSCRYKIYIIDEVHMLSNSAFNALLKTIEEPPPYVIFIFATTELQKVPATIKSRCQQFNFRLVPIEKVKEQLALAAREIGIKAEDEALYWIARESTGSMRDSYTLFDQVAAFSDGEITWEKIRDKLGLVGVDRLNELFGLCVAGKTDEVLLKLDEYLQNGVSIEQLITNCTDYLRSLLLIRNGVTKEALLGQNADRFNREVLSAWSSVQIERALSIFMQLYRDIRYSLSPRYEFELALSRLCWLKDYVSASEVKKAVDAVKPMLMNAAPARIVGAGVNASGSQGVSGGQQSFSGAQQMPSFSQGIPAGQGMPSGGASISGAQTMSSGWGTSAAGSQNMSGIQNASARQNTLPPNMPQFSALEGAEDDESESYTEEEYHPFPEGGAEPPETNSADGSQWAPETEPVPEPEASFATLGELEKTPEPAEGINTGDIKSVCNAMVNDFSAEGEALLASSLLQAENWTLEGDCVKCSVAVQFEQLQLRQQGNKIASYLSKVYGRTMSFEVNYEPPHLETKNVEYPAEVKILCDVFKGKITGGA